MIIIPAWNEHESIGDTLREVQSELPDFDVLVVDDGSTDNTAQIAANAGVAVLSLPYNLGVGGAMRAGYTYAQKFNYDRAIQLDADGQHDPRDVIRVLDGLKNASISIGARFAGKGDYEVKGPRHWAMVMLSTIVSKIARTRLTDITSGFRAADRRAIAQYVRHFPVEYLGDTIDSLVIAIRSGLSVTQVPVEMRPRRAGKPSNNPAKAAIYLFRAMFSLLVAMTRRPVRPRTQEN